MKGVLNIKFYVTHGASFDIIDEKIYVKGYATFEVRSTGSFGPDFFVISSFGVKLTSYIEKGESYNQWNTLLKEGSKFAKLLQKNHSL